MSQPTVRVLQASIILIGAILTAGIAGESNAKPTPRSWRFAPPGPSDAPPTQWKQHRSFGLGRTTDLRPSLPPKPGTTSNPSKFWISTSTTPSLGLGADERTPSCVPHPPIRITEEQGPNGFILGQNPTGDEPIYRPGSGVTDGRGTAEDPYVIEGWCIQTASTPSRPLSPSGIAFVDTTAHVIVRSNRVQSTNRPLPTTGISIEDAANVQLAKNTIASNDIGVFVSGARDLEFTNNTVLRNELHGIFFFQSTDIALQSNLLRANGAAGVRAAHTKNSSYRNNTLTRNSGGITIENTASAQISGNTFRRNGKLGGALVRDSPQTLIANNTFQRNSRGLHLSYTTGATLLYNSFKGNQTGLDVSGTKPGHFRHEIPASNTVHGEPIRYLWDEDGRTVRRPAGQVIVADARNITVRNVTLRDAGEGLAAAFTDGLSLLNSTVHGGHVGIELYHADAARIRNVTVTNAAQAATSAFFSQNLTVTRSRFTDNKKYGIYVVGSPSVQIEGNIARDNKVAMVVHGSDRATLQNNSLVQNSVGLGLLSSTRSSATANTVTDNDRGIFVLGGQQAEIRRNNIVSNDEGGLLVNGTDHHVEALDNWWGAPSGPSGGSEDACTGAVADGAGDAIVLENASACFDPWRMAPVVDAGPS